MKRVISALSMACLLLIPIAVLAQSEVGSWKLNTEKSKLPAFQRVPTVAHMLKYFEEGGMMNLEPTGRCVRSRLAGLRCARRCGGLERAKLERGGLTGRDCRRMRCMLTRFTSRAPNYNVTRNPGIPANMLLRLLRSERRHPHAFHRTAISRA